MSKLILKTTAITLASIIGVCSIVIGILMLCAPRSVAKVLDGMGGYSASVYFYEKQYVKTNSIDDLSVLVLKLDAEKDPIRLESYLSDMVKRKDFDTFCSDQDVNLNGGISTKEYYVGSYAVILVKNGKFDEAIGVASDFVRANGYTEYNPYSAIISQSGASLSKDDLNALNVKIINHRYGLSGQAELRATADLDKIQELIKLLG